MGNEEFLPSPRKTVVLFEIQVILRKLTNKAVYTMKKREG